MSMLNRERSIAIIGSGIAGLSTALALAQEGFCVTIYEKNAQLQEVGAGIQLSPNATRLLEKWGVLASILQHAVQPENIFLNDGMNGRILLNLPIRELAKQRWNGLYLTIHRKDLQNAFFKIAKKHPLIDFYFDHNLIEAKTIDEHVKIDFQHNKKKKSVESSCLIGCDGVWSTLRRLEKEQRQAAFTGYIAWRATIDATEIPDSFKKIIGKVPSVSAWMGSKNHLIAYPLQSGKTYNFVAITQGDNPGESWDRFGDQAQLFYEFREWHPAIRDIIMSTKEWSYWPLFGMKKHQFVRSPLQAYAGDSAHAFLPFAAQGAVMAIEDAAVLAQTLSQHRNNIDNALMLYSQLRSPRVASVNKKGNFNRFVYHATGPIALGRNLMMRLRSKESFASDLDWLYKYDATAIRTNS